MNETTVQNEHWPSCGNTVPVFLSLLRHMKSVTNKKDFRTMPGQ